MKQIYLKKLEYYNILEKLSSFCNTYIGKNLALNLLPSNDREIVQKSLLQTEQAVNLISRNSTPPISEIENVEIYIKLLESYSSLSAKALLDIAHILDIASNLKDYFNADFISNEEYRYIEEHFDLLYSNSNITNKIKDSIIDENTISDSASNTLSTIRRNERRIEQEIKNKLNSMIHSSNYSKYIQENVVTIRNNRYVIPVKEEYRNFIKGFMHDTSSSGSTIFIEPLAVFELNNELNNLKNSENIEIEKILQNLSTLLFPYTEELKKDIECIGILDFIFAKAKYSNSINAITPSINNEKYINLINAKHPLIDSNQVVPTTITIGKDFSLLIITGPNTGGKTVTLKTLGLLTCMACSGLNIPTEEHSSIYIFDEIFADIGDDQSISDSLSTFSSHMTNIIQILNNCTSESLILVDELGSGTDPVEGASIATSILEKLKNIGCITIATTHYQELKKYALVTPKVQNASVEFDIENLRPTYKLLIGIPGKSNAFAISKKLGLSESIINDASNRLDKKDIDFEEVLKKIYTDKTEIEHLKEETQKNLNQITLLRKNLERNNSILQKQEKDLIDNAKIKAREILLEAKEEANNIIKQMNEIKQNFSSDAELNNLRNNLNKSIKKYSINNTVEVSHKPIDKNLIKPGLEVFVTTFNQEATVLSNISKNNEVLVQIGLIKTNVSINYLEETHNKVKNKETSIKTSFNSFSKSKTISSEINIIGLTTLEATPLIEKFIDDCFLAHLSTARIVHGKGTGKLKNAVHEILKKNKHIKSFRMGTFGEGEMGVTVIELK